MAGQWFSPGALVSSTNKPDRHDITEILLKVALSTINQTKPYVIGLDLIHNIVSSTPRLSGVQTHNVIGDMH
jgi:hypothetical protein